MNPNPDLSKKTDETNPIKFINFYNKMKNLENIQTSDLQTYLEKPFIKKFFTQTIEELFPPFIEGSHDIFNHAPYNKFQKKDFSLQQHVIEFIIKTSKHFQISTTFVYHYLDEILSLSSQKIEDLLSQVGLGHHQKHLETLIYQTHIKHRNFYLQGIIDLLIGCFYDSDSNTQNIIQSFLRERTQEDFFMKMVQNLKTKENVKISHYYQSNIEQFYFHLLQEELLIQKIILLLQMHGYSSNDSSKILLQNLQMKQFQGSLYHNFLNFNTTEDQASFINIELNKESRFNQIMIALQIIFSNIDLDQPSQHKQKFSLLNQTNQIFKEIINEDEIYENSTEEFLINILKLVNQTIIEMHENESDTHQFNLFLGETYKEIESFKFKDFLLELIESGKQITSVIDTQSNNFLQILEYLWYLFVHKEEVFYDLIPQQDHFDILLTIFESCLQNDLTLCNFYKNKYEPHCILGDFVWFFQNSFPYTEQENYEFCRINMILLGNKRFNFVNPVVNNLNNMNRVMIKVEYNPEHKPGPIINTGFREYEKQKLGQQFTIENFAFDIDTVFYNIRPTNLYFFEKEFNFTSHMLNSLINIINDWKQNDKPFPTSVMYYLKLFCKILINSPAQITNFCFESSESILKTFFILLEYLYILQDNMANLEVILDLVSAIKEILESEYSQDFIYFYKIYLNYNGTPSQRNSLVSIFNKFEDIKEIEIIEFQRYEQTYLKILKTLTIILTRILQDEQIWINTLKQQINQLRNQNSFLLQDNFIALFDEGISPDTCQQLYQNLEFNAQRYAYNDEQILQDILLNFFKNIQNKFLNDSFHVCVNNTYLKYQIFAEIVEFQKIFYMKFNQNKQKEILIYNGIPQQTQDEYIQLLIQNSNQMNTIELIINGLNVQINKQKIDKEYDDSDGSIFLENTHIYSKVHQLGSSFAQNSIVQFLKKIVELLGVIFDLGTQFISTNNHNFQLLHQLHQLFCNQASLHKYKFNDMSIQKEINIILCLISLLQYELEYPLADEEWITNHQIFVSQDLFGNSEHAEQIIRIVDPSKIVNQNVHFKWWKKNISFQQAIFRTLTIMLKYWRTQNLVDRPSFKNYVYGYMSNLSNMYIFKVFLYDKILVQFQNYNEEVINFLLEIEHSQTDVLLDLLDMGVENSNGPLFLYMQKLLNSYKVETSSLLDPRINIFKLKNLQLVTKLFKCQTIPLKQMDNIWSNFYPIFVDLFFKILEENKDTPIMIGNFTSAKLLNYFEQKEQTSDSLNLLQIKQILQKEKIISLILENFSSEFLSQFKKRINSQQTYIFKLESNYFFSSLSKNYENFINYTQSNSSIQSEILLNYIHNNEVPQILKKISSQSEQIKQQDNQSYFQQRNTQFQFIEQQEGTQRYNPLEIYLQLKMIGIDNDVALQTLYFAEYFNQIEKLINTRKLSYENLTSILEVVSTTGIEGHVLGCDSIAKPISPTMYIYNLMTDLQIQDNQQNVKFENLLRGQFKQMLGLNSENQSFFDINQTSKKIFSLLDKEKEFLHPFSSKEKYITTDLVQLYSKNQHPHLNQEKIKEVQQTHYMRFTQTIQQFIDLVQEVQDFEYLSFDQITNALKIYIIHQKALIHFTQNIFHTTNFTLKNSYQKQIENFLTELSKLNQIIQEKLYHSPVDILYYFEALYLSINFLSKTGYQSSEIYTIKFYELIESFIFNFLISNCKLNETMIIKMVVILENILLVNPNLITIQCINTYSKLLRSQNLTDKIFLHLLDLFQTITSSGYSQNDLIHSDLLKDLQLSTFIQSDPNYQSQEFYHNNEYQLIVSKSIKMFTLVNSIVTINQKNKNLWEFLYGIFSAYKKRIFLILGMEEVDLIQGKNLLEDRVEYKFKNLAYLTELNCILDFTKNLSQFKLEWQKMDQDSTIVLTKIVEKTLNLFSYEYQLNTKGIDNFQDKNVSDKILPMNSFEKFLSQIILQDDQSHFKPSEIIISRDLNTVQKKNLNELKNYKQGYIQDQGIITSVFSQLVDYICSLISINSAMTIYYLSDIHAFQEDYLCLGVQPNQFQERIMKTNKRLVNCLLYNMYIIQKLSFHQSLFNQAIVKLHYLYYSSENSLLTHNCNINLEFISVLEWKFLARKSFELFLGIQTKLLQNLNETKSDKVYLITSELQKYQDWIKHLVNEYEQFLQPQNQSQSISSHRSPFKSIKRQSLYKNMDDYGDFENLDEQQFVNRVSLEEHTRNIRYWKEYLK